MDPIRLKESDELIDYLYAVQKYGVRLSDQTVANIDYCINKAHVRHRVFFFVLGVLIGFALGYTSYICIKL